MTALPETDWREWAARKYEAKPRQWARPFDLAAALDPESRQSRPLEIIDRELVRLTDNQVPADALAVFMAPQEGKSQRVARRYPEWLLSHDPALRIAIVSYEQEMAVRWGRQILRDLRQAPKAVVNVSVLPDTTAAGRWETPEGGGVFCTGIGGGLTGRPVDILLVDDPVKDRAHAESDKIRNATWDWWENVALTRLAPGAKVVIIQTRWHQDDLSGRILSRPSPLRWRVLSMPALSTGAGDPLGRPAGVEFPSVRGRAPGYFTNLKATTSSYTFSSIYQQDPVAAEGNFFRRASFRYWRWTGGRPAATTVGAGAVKTGARLEIEGRHVDLADPAVWRFATVDVAASTKTSADFTVCAVWAISRDGDLILLDRHRNQVTMSDHFAMVKTLRDKWQFDLAYVEKQFYSQTLVQDARANGVPVAEVQADTDKITRAIPAAGRLHSGKVWFPAVTSGCPCGNCGPAGDWLDEWCDELASFDRGTHDDQVDTFSYAARIVAAHWTPPPPPGRPKALSPDLQRIEHAVSAATGLSAETPPPDLMHMPLG